MYAQTTHIRVPLGHMSRLRGIIQREYLPKIQARPGFVSALFMEQVDDADRAELVIVWNNHAAVESFNSTGMLEATIHGLAAYLPDVQVQRQGYALTVVCGAQLEEVDAYARA
jgi:hypothetical protein